MAIPDFFSALFQRYVENNCSPEEVEQLFKLMATDEYADYTRELIERSAGKQVDPLPLDDELKQRLAKRLQVIFTSDTPVISIRKRNWAARIAVAATVLVLIGSGSYYLARSRQGEKTDVLPGGNRAMLTLGNGKQIILDSAGDGMLARQGNTAIYKTDSGKIAYESIDGHAAEIVMNTLTTPRGGQYQLILPDGSKVWLNAASSIKYPTAFTGSERLVEITGEAYFDVVHNAKQPFHVKAGNQVIEDLGTEFNVMAYEEEKIIQTTLLQGSAKVKIDSQSLVLSVGQQAEFNKGHLHVVDGVNTEEVIAWKNGFFDFESAGLQTILRQYSRWYDVEVIYEGKMNDRKFFAVVKRNSTLKSVLDMLGDNNIKYRIEGKKLIIKSE